MARRKDTTTAAGRAAAFAEMVDRLALAACGAKLWPNPYAREYHRAVVRRTIAAMTAGDLELIRQFEGATV